MATSPLCQGLVDQVAEAVDNLAAFDQETSDWLEIRNFQRAGMLGILYSLYYQLALCQAQNPAPIGPLFPTPSQNMSEGSRLPRDLTKMSAMQTKEFFEYVNTVKSRPK